MIKARKEAIRYLHRAAAWSRCLDGAVTGTGADPSGRAMSAFGPAATGEVA